MYSFSTTLFYLFKVKYSWFTVLCWFQVYSKVSQFYICALFFLSNYFSIIVLLLLLSSCWVESNSFVTPWTVAYQAPLSMRFPRQEYWSGLLFLPPGDLPDPGMEPRSPALAGGCCTAEPTGKPPTALYYYVKKPSSIPLYGRANLLNHSLINVHE